MVRDNAKKHAMQYRKVIERIQMEDRHERSTDKITGISGSGEDGN